MSELLKRADEVLTMLQNKHMVKIIQYMMDNKEATIGDMHQSLGIAREIFYRKMPVLMSIGIVSKGEGRLYVVTNDNEKSYNDLIGVVEKLSNLRASSNIKNFLQ